MEKMPVLFVGHGSPMNAIEDNEFSREWEKIGKEIPEPKAVLCVSAHWLTHGTMVTAMKNPKTIHDFGDFPKELFNIQYNAPGSVEFAERTRKLVRVTKVEADMNWGLDHGTWSVLIKMYPKANIPVFQLSIDKDKPAEVHYQIGKELKELRNNGVLIMGSGNIVHNLGQIVWDDNEVYDWAVEFDEKIKTLIDQRDDKNIIDYKHHGEIARLSVPYFDHYYPLLYVLGASDATEPIKYYNEKMSMGSLSMRCVKIG